MSLVSTLLRIFVKISKVVQKFEEITLGDLASTVFFIKNRKYDKWGNVALCCYVARILEVRAVMELTPVFPGVLLRRLSNLN